MPNTRDPGAGEIWLVGFDPQVGREQGGIRPALVISNDDFNGLGNGLRIIVPITRRDRGLPFQVRIEPPEGGLTSVSMVMCEQERSQSVDRFLRRRGTVMPATLHTVQHIVARFIDADRLRR